MDLKSCACCGEKTLPAANISYICPICGWEDDEIQNLKPDYDGGANHISLNAAKKAFSEGKPLQPLNDAAWDRFIQQEAAAALEPEEVLEPASAEAVLV